MDKITFSNEGKPIRCKAAVCRKAGEAFVIEEIQVDPPQAYEVRIKILCTSLCHTDVTFWKLDNGPLARFPRILGHEAVGVVESIGENVDRFKQGDVVLPVFHPQCEECKDCKSSKSNWCARFADDFLPNTRRYGMASRFKDSSGQDIHHLIFVSSFSEYTVVDIAHLVKISSEIPVDKACLLSCGVATGLGAVWKVADVEEGSTVAIFGIGAVGLAVAEAARLRGAAKIIGVDLNPDKFEIAKADAYVWRPTTNVLLLGDALGNKIPWPSDKIILDTEEDSPAENQTSPASELLDKIIIYDWNFENVQVAEGRLCSTDPKQLVDNIPLGPNAAMVKIEKVIKTDAYLWRPSTQMSVVGDALDCTIAWPIQKIDLVNKTPKQSSPIASSPAGSANNSVDTSKSIRTKKCILLDCGDSGKVVAEGRVTSTNPQDTVHFVPIGDNASKVWVKVAKIGDARVWRPNSEVQFISDALGTTVAWPNDKIKFI